MAHNREDDSVLHKLDAAAAPLAKFDAFSKVPSAYKARSESRGFVTVFVMLVVFVFMLNDIGEYIWGWPEFRFAVDKENSPYMFINLDMAVNMPCGYLSIDLRDVLGDRLMLSGGLRRDGHSDALSASQITAQSRRSRGLFDTLLSRNNEPKFKPTYTHEADASACRIYGTLAVKRVTANLHITTLGHGYASYQHVDHSKMNLSHVITEFSFGPYFPDITQPLDNSFEVTQDHFTAYQYYLHVVPTTYIAPRSRPLQTNQYSVTHYTRVLEHNQGTPGIFFKFDLDPMSITVHQKTTTLIQLLIRCVGVIGGVFVCMGYAIRITTRAVEVVSGADSTPGIVAAEASGVKVGLRSKWGGSELRARTQSGRMIRQGNGWVLEGSTNSPYSSYAPTPVTGQFAPPASPYLQPGTAPPQSAVGLGFPSSAFGPGPSGTGTAPGTPNVNGHNGHLRTPSLLGGPPRTPRTPRTPYTSSLQANGAEPPVAGGDHPGTPSYQHFPPTPGSVNGTGNGNGHDSFAQQQAVSGVLKDGKKDD
ncbi:DUF1692-domain-containing protein [Macrolepiota fuliginosa MF-IS2]|uniref:DUF1692-domain-containing protein n=1 Tax=Macrolepiota fuliginosa MF-IS2 TaxID=1400762 RepID=A0A9P5XE88_9AGAR|nr:DUF1692-domain-containing protein [Macrolepiota fuliginosa MF-IS2]